MESSATTDFDDRKAAEMLVLPFCQEQKEAVEASAFTKVQSSYSIPLSTKDFVGKEGELLILYADTKQEQRTALLGLGDRSKLSIETLRRAYAALAKNCISKKIRSVNVVVPKFENFSTDDVLRGILEGILLANYEFTKLKKESQKEEPTTLLREINLIGVDNPNHALALVQKYLTICKSVYMVRDLVNGNADDVTPQHLEEIARHLATSLPQIKVKTLTKREIELEKLGLLLAVNRGSNLDPALIILTYQGAPESRDHTVLVGKGVTYDTGGLNIKPTGSMETMKCDMAGAALVLGVIRAVATLGLPLNLSIVIPSTENAICSQSFKPGDVYISHNGKSVEIGNTDAEGRLILADALSYTVKNLNPTRIIDFATLTGAIDIALGPEATGLFSNNDLLATQLYDAGEETFERLWRLPLYSEYRDNLKSDIADIKNIGGRSGGSIIAAIFLKEFVADLPWAHLDIASSAFLSESRRYLPKLSTGIGVRLMVQFFENELKKNA